MVFYFFVYHNVARKSRKVDQVRLSNGKVLTQVKSVNGLMQQKAMPITSVKFEGWLATPTSSVEEQHPLLNDESLAEMLARVSREQEQHNKSKRRIISTKKKKKPSSTPPYKPPKDSRFQFASESDIADSEEKFSPPMACVTVSKSPLSNTNTCGGAGCMRVKTLQESLSSSNSDKNGLDTQNSIQTGTTLSCSNASSSSSSVHFGTVEIRQYEYCLGDNPACSSGPPIMLDWKYSTIGAFSVHDYDDYRDAANRHGEASTISYHDRVELLRKLGYSRSDMIKAENQRKKDQAQREETIYRLKFMQREEKTERVKKRFKTVLHIR